MAPDTCDVWSYSTTQCDTPVAGQSEDILSTTPSDGICISDDARHGNIQATEPNVVSQQIQKVAHLLKVTTCSEAELSSLSRTIFKIYELCDIVITW